MVIFLSDIFVLMNSYQQCAFNMYVAFIRAPQISRNPLTHIFNNTIVIHDFPHYLYSVPG